MSELRVLWQGYELRGKQERERILARVERCRGFSPLSLPKGFLSPSQIKCYYNCPMQYYFRYVRRRPERPSGAMVEGSCMSRVMSFYHHYHAEYGTFPSPAVLNQIFGLILDDEVTGLRRNKLTNFNLVEWKAAVENRWSTFFSNNVTQESSVAVTLPGGRIGSETGFILEFSGLPPVIGFIDLLSEHCLRDYKVAANSYYYKPEFDLQLAIYGVAVKRDDVGFILCEKKSGKVKVLTAALDLRKSRAWIRKIVQHVTRGIRNGVFPPRDTGCNNLCKPEFCSHYDRCFGKVTGL